jgi:hypothetical protein
MYVWRSLKSLTLPSGFYDRQVTYRDEYVGAAAIPDREDLVLLYLSDKTGEKAGYYIYDEKSGILFPYLTVASVYANFTLIWPDESVIVPEGFTKTTLKWNEKDVPAWTKDDTDGAVYLIYARNSSGETGLYLFNKEDESVQRFIVPVKTEPQPAGEPTADPTAKPVSAQDDEKQAGFITIDDTLFYAVCGTGVLLLVIVVALLILYAKKSAGKKSEQTNNDKEDVDRKSDDKEAAGKRSDDNMNADRKSGDKEDSDRKRSDKKNKDKKRGNKKDAKRKAPGREEGETVIHVRDAKF